MRRMLLAGCALLLLCGLASAQSFPTWQPDGNGGLTAVVEGGITGAIKVAVGTTAQRPATPTTGHVRYNSTDGVLEFRDADAWERPLLTSGLGSVSQAYDADLADLADGSLSGSKVGTGIDAGNVSAGTLNAARLPSTLQTLNTSFVPASASGGTYLQFFEDTDNGTDAVYLMAPDSITTTGRHLKLPDVSGFANSKLLADVADYSGKVLGFSRVDTSEATTGTHTTAQELATTQQLTITVSGTTTVIVEGMCSAANAVAGNGAIIMVDPGTGTAVELGRTISDLGAGFNNGCCGAKSFSIAAGSHTFKMMFRSTSAVNAATFVNRSLKVTVQ